VVVVDALAAETGWDQPIAKLVGLPCSPRAPLTVLGAAVGLRKSADEPRSAKVFLSGLRAVALPATGEACEATAAIP
jgi:hypothetical protein